MTTDFIQEQIRKLRIVTIDPGPGFQAIADLIELLYFLD